MAIGKSGQNVRLASKLTGWNLDIVKDELPATKKPDDEPAPEPEVAETQTDDETTTTDDATPTE
ncbi:MAG: hypothetical protein AAB701_00780 [Patescibacteria group bacterium]